jgi:hypothetical protein
MSNTSQTPSGEQYTGYGYGGQPIDPYTGQPFPPGYGQRAQKSNALGITSLTLGIVGLLLSWIPIISYLAFALGILGVVFGGIGIFKSHRLMSIIGTALGVITIVVSIITYVSLVNDLNGVVDKVNAATSGAQSDEVIVTPAPGYEEPYTGEEAEGEGYPYGGEEGLQGEIDANADIPIAEVNSRGNIVKAIGEDAGVGGLQRGVDTAVWSVDEVETDISCTESYRPDKPQNGHLTAVDMNLSTGADFNDYTGGYGMLSGMDFEFIDSQGVTHDDIVSFATYGCLAPSETFNDGVLGSAQNYNGKIILDLPDTEGTLVFSPSWSYDFGSTGWEYPVG